MTEPSSESLLSRLRKWFRPRVIIPVVVGILLLLQVTTELIAWELLLGLWRVLWPVIITAAVGVVGIIILLRRRRPVFAGLFIAVVILGFVAVRFALSAIGDGEVL